MTTDTLSLLLKAKLETLFTSYAEQLKHQKQREIVSRGFAFSQINVPADILVMGINPSQRTDFLQEDGVSYTYTKLESDRYFKKFHQLLKSFEGSVAYADLFYQKHTEQKDIDHFLNDDIGRSFLKEQLILTKEIIDTLNPKIILLFNRKGANFFTTEWLGLEAQKLTDSCIENFNKTFMLNSDQSMSLAHIDDLYKLKGRDTLLYLSTFIGYRTRKESIMTVKKDISEILDLLKPTY